MVSGLPPGQHLAAPGKWPTVGERLPTDPEKPWTLTIQGLVKQAKCFSLAELRSLPQEDFRVDLHCVTRWSKLAVPFRGIRLTTLLDPFDIDARAGFLSFTARSERRHSSSLPLEDAAALGVFLALEAEGQPLPVERGGPLRVVTPGRYFYKSVKWLEIIDLLEHDRLGFWEAEAGYHNTADPWREQRYIASRLSRSEAGELIASRDFRGRDLLSIDVSQRPLDGLKAAAALLRNADFRGCSLRGSDFGGANLANSHLQEADLSNARFVNADLEGADFRGADLRGADFRGASLFGATFFDATFFDGDRESELSPLVDIATRFDSQSLEQLAPEQRTPLEALLNAARPSS